MKHLLALLAFGVAVQVFGGSGPTIPPPPPATPQQANEGTNSRSYISPATLAAWGNNAGTNEVWLHKYTPADSSLETGGGTDATAATQALLDSITNRPFLILRVKGAFLLANHRALQWHSNTWIQGDNMYSSGFYAATSNNAPMLQNDLNTNYASPNLFLTDITFNHNGGNQNTLIYSGGNPQQGACTANGTNIYCVTIWSAGVSNHYIGPNVRIIQPPVYGTLCSSTYNTVYEKNIIDYRYAGNCGGDGWHFWGDGHDLTLKHLKFWGRQGDVVAINVSETKQLVRSPYWSTNINVLHYLTIEDLDVHTNGSNLGLNPVNIQVNDDSYSRIGHIDIRHIRADQVDTCLRTPFTRCGTFQIEDIDIDGILYSHNEKSFLDGAGTNAMIGRIRFKNTGAYVGETAFGLNFGTVIGSDINYTTSSGAIGFAIQDAASVSLVNVFQNGGDTIMVDGNSLDQLLADLPALATTRIRGEGLSIVGGGQINGIGHTIFTNAIGGSFSPRVFYTNFVSGQVYSPALEGPVMFKAQLIQTLAAVNGNSRMDIEKNGVRIAGPSTQTTTSTVAVTNLIDVSFVVDVGDIVDFTNKSVGVGNGVVIFTGTGRIER